jgi:hypothetical protein
LARGLTSFGGSYLSGKASADAAALDKSSLADALAYFSPTHDVNIPGASTDVTLDMQTAGNAMAGAPKASVNPEDFAGPNGQPVDSDRLQARQLEMPDISSAPQKYTLGVGPYSRTETYSPEEQMTRARAAQFSSNPVIRSAAAGEMAQIEAERAQAEAKALRDRPVFRANTQYGGSVVNPNTQEVISSVAPPPAKPSNKTPFAAVVNGKPGMFVYDDAGQLEAVPGMTPFRTGGEGGEKPPPGFRYDAKRNLVAIPGGPGDLRTTQQGFTQENTLRDEYQKGAKSFSVVNDAYSKISSVPASPTGDLSMLYNYMKMLDPNSVVRESEFRVAATARPLLENLGLSWDRIGSVWSGNRMTPGQRADFQKSAKGVYGAALNNQTQWDAQYTDLATNYGLDPKHVVTGSARYKNKQDPIASARAAIAAGADRTAVIKRLKDANIDTTGF